MTQVERRNYNIHRDIGISCQVKTENVINKCRLYQSMIKEKDDETQKLALEKLPFFDQMKLADINITLNILNYKLSYCTKYLELIYEYVKLMFSIFFGFLIL